MHVDLKARVWTRDGHEAGRVERAVIDPGTGEVSAFVVSTGGLFGKDVVVDRRELERATRDGDDLHLDLTKRDLDDLPAFVPDSYGPPPEDWVPPGAGYLAGDYLFPMGAAPAMLPADPLVASEQEDLPGLTKGAPVLDASGDEVGVVDDLHFDAGSGQLRGAAVRLGGALRTMLGGGEKVEIGRDQIERVEDGLVRLRERKEELRLAA